MRFNLLNGINIQFKGNYGFQAELLTGTIEVPDIPGGYVISTGCGSGKTTVIKEIIRCRYNDGILYCVDTKEEAWKMFKWITDVLIPEVNRLDPNDPYRLTPDDVVVIFQENTDKGRIDITRSAVKDYNNNPECLLYKKIVIITHVRMFTDLANFFMIYNPQVPVNSFDGDFPNLMQREDLRKYILFDETPQQIEPFYTYSALVFNNFRLDTTRGMYEKFFNNNIQEWFEARFGKSHIDLPNKTLREKIKRDCVITNIPRYENISKPLKPEEYDLYYYPIHLVQHNMKSMVLVWEGAGDILFQKQNNRFLNYKIIENIGGNKYNSNVLFQEFPHEQTRSDINYINSQDFKDQLGNIATIINNHYKTLVVVWKWIGDEKKQKNGGYIEDYSNFIKSELNKIYPDPTKYEVIYYGAANTKSTNDFVDFDSIVLCGDWNVWDYQPDNKKVLLCHAYDIELKMEYVKLWYFVQLITRTGIRKHDGGNYCVYYSSSINDNFKRYLREYFHSGGDINQVKFSSNCKSIDPLTMKLDSVKSLKSNVKTEIRNLIDCHDLYFREVIIRDDLTYTSNITISDLRRICPREYNAPSDYKKLISNLSKLGIFLNII